MKNSLVVIILTCVSTFAFAAPSGGGSAGKNSVGLLAGVGWVDTSSNALSLGAELKFALTDSIPIGVYFLSYGASVSLNHTDPDYTTDVSSSAKHYGFTTGYKVNFIPGGEFGLRAAYVRSNSDAKVTTAGTERVSNVDSSANFALAPKVAVEFMMGKASVGGEVDYFFGFGQNAPKGFFLLIPIRYYY